MRARNVIVVAGLACAAGWLAKMVVMVRQGSPDEPGLADDLPFFVGLLSFVVLAAATGVHLRRDCSLRTRVGAGLVGILVGGTGLSVVQLALTMLPGDAWWQPELAFVVAACVALVVAFMVAKQAGPAGEARRGLSASRGNGGRRRRS